MSRIQLVVVPVLVIAFGSRTLQAGFVTAGPNVPGITVIEGSTNNFVFFHVNNTLTVTNPINNNSVGIPITVDVINLDNISKISGDETDKSTNLLIAEVLSGKSMPYNTRGSFALLFDTDKDINETDKNNCVWKIDISIIYSYHDPFRNLPNEFPTVIFPTSVNITVNDIGFVTPEPSPIPEPSSIVEAGIGAILLGGLVLRRHYLGCV